MNELCTEGFDFIIPSYQRGYRWTRKEVIRLILDVLSYNQDKDGKFYCLQPLVVRHKEVNGQHIWRVIDGQQRLTTIFLLLNYLIKDEKKYSLEYERDNVLLKTREELKRLLNIPVGDDFAPVYLVSKLFEHTPVVVDVVSIGKRLPIPLGRKLLKR